MDQLSQLLRPDKTYLCELAEHDSRKQALEVALAVTRNAAAEVALRRHVLLDQLATLSAIDWQLQVQATLAHAFFMRCSAGLVVRLQHIYQSSS